MTESGPLHRWRRAAASRWARVHTRWVQVRTQAGARVEPHVRAVIEAAVRRELAPIHAVYAAAEAEREALRETTTASLARADALYARLDRSPFTAGLTVHAAHARNPGVAGVFGRHGLPRCVDCAVGADETLAEAAFGEGLELDGLLAELNALPEVFG